MTRSQLETSTLGEIASRDVRAGAILDRYGLDYCCGGTRSLADGCARRGVDLARVVSDLESLDPAERETPDEDPAALVAYIVARHHTYIRTSAPLIQQHLAKVVAKHAASHPELGVIAALFDTVADELRLHMVKEEQVLFLYIRALADAMNNGAPPPPDMFGTVQNPIRVMEIEHQEAGEGMANIRELSRDYRIPADACTTYRLVYQELAEFEQDLHQHVHLENHVLFPKAIELEAKAGLIERGLKSQRSE
jgi:regulator of cell morphogenesis and NO signaling